MPFGTPNFIGVHTTAELAALPIEKVRRGMWCWNSTNARPEIYDGTAWVPFVVGGVPVPGVDIQDVGSLVSPGTNAEYARDDHEHRGVRSIAAGGPDIFGDVTLSPGNNIVLTQLGDDIEISASLPAGGTEKIDDFFDVGAVPQTRLNGSPAQRCNTILANGRRCFLHEENNLLYLTVVNKYMASPDIQEGPFHTRTYKIEVYEYISQEPVEIEMSEICMVAEVGDTEGEMLHISLIGMSPGAGDLVNQVYSIYVPTMMLPYDDAEGVAELTFAAPYGDGVPTHVFAEKVNQAMSDDPCMHVSMCAVENLLLGPGVAVVWVRDDDDVQRVWSNFYDPTQVPGSRYAAMVSGYLEARVDIAVQTDSRNPTVEADAGIIHCAYMNEGDLYYSNTGVTGIPLAPGVWDNIYAGIMNVGKVGQFVTTIPSMVNIYDAQRALMVLYVAVLDDTASPTEMMVYSFTDTGVPIMGNRADLLNADDTDNGVQYQLAADDNIYAPLSGRIPTLYIYRVVVNQYSPNAFSFVVSFIGADKPQSGGYAWYHVTIDAIVFVESLVLPAISPHAHYSQVYNPRGWKDHITNRPWYPLANYMRTAIGSDGLGGITMIRTIVTNNYME